MSALHQLAQRLRLIVSRGVVELVNDTLKMQSMQVTLLSDETQDDVERFQDYGITCVPFDDAEVLVMSVGGDRSHAVVVRADDRRHRPKGLVAGDVCLYTDKGERVYLDRVADIVHLGDKSGAAFVSRIGDKTTSDTTMSTWMTAVGTAITAMAVGFNVAPAGTPVVSLGVGGVVPPTPATDFGEISTGASKVKAT